MIKRVITILSLTLVSLSALACDICGCGAGGGYLGIMPGFRKKFISVRYLQNGLISHLGPDGRHTYLTAHENFRIVELWGAANVGRKFRVAAFAPYSFLQRKDAGGIASQSGIGDFTAIGYYQLLDKQQTTAGSKLFVHSLWAGGGAKLPTGKYNPVEKNVLESSQNTFQLGTGSTDFSLNAMYDARLQDAGVNVNMAYRLNTVNKYGYRFGNRLTTNVLGYYKIRIRDKVTIASNTGVLYEISAKDHKAGDVLVWETGGNSLMGTAGMEFSFGKLGAGLNYQAPLYQNVGERKVRIKDRGMAYLSYSF